MTKLPWWKRALMGLGVAVAGLAGLAAHPRPGHSAETHAPPQAGNAPKFRYFGSESCGDCHAVTPQRPTRSTYAEGFIKLNEFLTWSEQDKHSLAYVSLNLPRGREMANRLGVDVTKPESGCLGCHSAGTSELNDRNQGRQFNRNEGVSCENCHGPYSGWGTDHTQPEYRGWDSKKRAEVGMIDVRVPEIQATQCLSCHIGDSSQGKVVTHEMYAAGHPPLPSIEVATFADSIPRHWFLMKEKAAKVRQAAGFSDKEQERTKLAVVGAAVALRTSMNLLADESRADGGTEVPGLDWPDYARFDCWSCHHDLKRESWRQARGFAGSPGRPPISEWPLAIVELGIDRLELANAAGPLRAELAGHQKAVLDEAYARPYGLRTGLPTAAQAFATWLNVLIQKLSQASYDDEVALKLLTRLVAKAEERSVDYDAARQVAWTIRILAADAGSKLPPETRKSVEAIIKEFEKGLKLELPAGRNYKLEEQLGEALQLINDYEPSDFRARLKDLAGLLPPP